MNTKPIPENILPIGRYAKVPRRSPLTEILFGQLEERTMMINLLDPLDFDGAYRKANTKLPPDVPPVVRGMTFAISVLISKLPGNDTLKNSARIFITDLVAHSIDSAETYFAPTWRNHPELYGIVAVASLARGAVRDKLSCPVWESRFRTQAIVHVGEHLGTRIAGYRTHVNCYGRDGRSPAHDFCMSNCSCWKMANIRSTSSGRKLRCMDTHGIHAFCGHPSLDNWNRILDNAMLGVHFTGGTPHEGILARYR